MKNITVTKNDSDQRVDKFLSKTLRSLPINLMYKYIRTKRIKLNSKRCNPQTQIKENDIISLYISDEFFEPDKYKSDFKKAPRELDILYEDENIMILNKPVGLIVHPDEHCYLDCLINRVLCYLFHKGEYDPEKENSFVPSLVNRIDRNTCGIVIAAKNAESLRILNSKMKNHELSKYYLALIHGNIQKKQDVLIAYLKKNKKLNRVYIYNNYKENTKIIKTKYKILKEKDNLSLVEIELLTGRTHQIRAHMAFIGHPLAGDGKYGTNEQNKHLCYNKQALCSYKLKFNFKSDSGLLNYLNNREFKVKNIWFLEYF